jgi:hypothetical protein
MGESSLDWSHHLHNDPSGPHVTFWGRARVGKSTQAQIQLKLCHKLFHQIDLFVTRDKAIAWEKFGLKIKRGGGMAMMRITYLEDVFDTKDPETGLLIEPFKMLERMFERRSAWGLLFFDEVQNYLNISVGKGRGKFGDYLAGKMNQASSIGIAVWTIFHEIGGVSGDKTLFKKFGNVVVSCSMGNTEFYKAFRAAQVNTGQIGIASALKFVRGQTGTPEPAYGVEPETKGNMGKSVQERALMIRVGKGAHSYLTARNPDFRFIYISAGELT